MSSISFHFIDGEVRIGGTERAYAGVMCGNLTTAVLDFGSYPRIDDPIMARVLKMLPADHYAHEYMARKDPRGLATALTSALSRGFGDGLAWKGHPVEEFSLALNTVLTMGGDALRFVARVHGQCEIHGWCDGPNRAWLAGIVEDGVEDGILRQTRPNNYDGWEVLATTLRESDIEPVVMSYSVCDSFPSYRIAHPLGRPWKELTEDEQEKRTDEADAWNEDTECEQQWRECVTALRQSPERGLELKPDNWETFRFMHKLSAFDVAADDWERRLDAAFGIDASRTA